MVGVDRGIRRFAVCSDGTWIDSPRALQRSLRKLRRRARAVSRKQPGSRNRTKAALALARCHRRVRNQRADALHKATTALAKAKSVIVVEDLHVAGMLRNRHLARAIADQGWAEFHRQLGYKTAWYGSRLLVAPRFLSVVEDLLWLRAGQGGPAAWHPRLLLSGVWAGPRPRPERREQPRPPRGDRGRARRRQFGGDAKRLWRGQRWPGRQRPGGTAFGEAGTDSHLDTHRCVGSDERCTRSPPPRPRL